jgi:hypothetical protein
VLEAQNGGTLLAAAGSLSSKRLAFGQLFRPSLVLLAWARGNDGVAHPGSLIRGQRVRGSARRLNGNVCFEPGGFRDGVDEFALYVYRGPQGIAAKQLLPPEYTPLYREWPWYRDAQAGAMWSEPYVDEGGGEIPMVTFSTPIRREGRRVGVVTANPSLEYFNALERAMQSSRLGGSAYAYVITKQGTVLRLPDARLRFPEPGSRLQPLAAPELQRVWSRILAGASGAEHGRDPRPVEPRSSCWHPWCLRAGLWSGRRAGLNLIA